MMSYSLALESEVLPFSRIQSLENALRASTLVVFLSTLTSTGGNL